MGRAIEKNYTCPICGKKSLFVGVHDDEGNYHGMLGCEYEQDPWSGLAYALHHDGWGDCVLCTDGSNEVMGGVLFNTAQEAADALPTLPQPSNEALTLEELREMDGVNALWVHDLAWGLHKPRLMLVHGITEDWWMCCDFNGFETFNADDYGDRYLLYRRPPEGEEGA